MAGAHMAAAGSGARDRCRVPAAILIMEVTTMEAEAIIQAVSTLGFPIVMCAALLYYLNLERQSHKDEMNSMKDALDRNTTIMTELKEMLAVITGIKRKDQQ